MILFRKSTGGKAEVGEDRPLPVVPSIATAPTTLRVAGRRTVVTAGTQLPIAATSTPLPRGGCYLIPYPTNTGVIYFGDSNVDNTYPMIGAGQVIPYAIDDANKIYIDASVSGEGCSFVEF